MLSLDGIPLLGTLDWLEHYVGCLELRVRGWLVRHIPTVPDSGDLGRLSNPRRARLRTPDQ